jgi:hypothetical protein
MRRVMLAILIAVGTISDAQALDQAVTIEGPVEIISPTAPGDVTYSIIGTDGIKYRVVLPDTERERLSYVLKQNPSSVIRFDGAVVAGNSASADSVPTFNARKWRTVTTTTVTENRDGTQRVEKTTVTK